MPGPSKLRGLVAALLLLAFASACQILLRRESEEDEPLPVRQVEEEIVVAAWAEPRHLPPGGGQAQILVRVQKRGGAPFAGVEVRLRASVGTLYSGGKILVTDARGLARDRLSTPRTAQVTLNAGGTRYRFKVNVDDVSPGPSPNVSPRSLGSRSAPRAAAGPSR